MVLVRLPRNRKLSKRPTREGWNLELPGCRCCMRSSSQMNFCRSLGHWIHKHQYFEIQIWWSHCLSALLWSKQQTEHDVHFMLQNTSAPKTLSHRECLNILHFISYYWPLSIRVVAQTIHKSARFAKAWQSLWGWRLYERLQWWFGQQTSCKKYVLAKNLN